MPRLRLALLPGRFAICRLPSDGQAPPWSADFWSLTRTAKELSLVCAEPAVPPGAKAESGWRVLEIQGPFDFSATGILASVAGPLAGAGISIFAISTFDTDYVLVKEGAVAAAVRVLEAAGHRVEG